MDAQNAVYLIANDAQYRERERTWWIQVDIMGSIGSAQSIHWPLSAAENQTVIISFTWCTLAGLDPRLNFDLVS